jgi:flagellin-specific chaperone FliS
MANKRLLKKDIRSITTLIIADALELASRLTDAEAQEKVLDIIVSITEIHNELISRVNHPDGKDNSKLIKTHYKKVVDDLMKSYSDTYEQLGKIAS